MNQARDDADRFRAAIQRHYVGVVNYLARRMHDRDDAEDLAQMVFEFAWRRIQQMPPEPDTLHWLFRIARWCLNNHWRAGKRRSNLLARIRWRNSLVTPDEWDTKAELDDVTVAFSRLHPKQQEVLRLVAWDQLTRVEAAAVLGCSVNAFDIRLHRSRSALQREFIAIQESNRLPIEQDRDVEEN